MRRIAASRVFLNEKEYLTNTVVEIYDAMVVNHYPIESETAMTEWLGGAIVLTANEDIAPSSVTAINDFYRHTEQDSSPLQPSSATATTNKRHKLFAYHISAFNMADNTLSPKSVVRKIIEI